jgi:hypothetical protein
MTTVYPGDRGRDLSHISSGVFGKNEIIFQRVAAGAVHICNDTHKFVLSERESLHQTVSVVDTTGYAPEP